GGVRAELPPRRPGADAVVFEHRAEGRLRYAGLRSWDARGRDLPSRMELREEPGGGTRLTLVVDAAGAAYPVTVDPIVSSPAWTTYGGEAGARFGGLVAS